MRAAKQATVFGANGFIGRHLTGYLRECGWEVLALGRNDTDWRGRPLGHVFYCIGLTADFRSRPFDTIEAHVSLAVQVLRNAELDSFLYCSSTRVYAGGDCADEAGRLTVDPNDPSDLYNLSKLTGEAACLAVPRAHVRVARLSNVFGADDVSDNFLTSVLRDAVTAGRVEMRSAPNSAKDYVAVEDVVAALLQIAERGEARIYNVAAGRNTTHAEILAAVQAGTGCGVAWPTDNLPQVFPLIMVGRLRALMDWRPTYIEDRIAGLIAAARSR